MDIDLLDPEPFARNTFWPTFAWLRAHAPVHHHQEEGTEGFFVLSRHRDIMEVYADPRRFSSRYGMRLGSNPAAISGVAQRMLIVSDAPSHTFLKRVLMQAFTGQAMQRMEQLVRTVVHDVIAEAVTLGTLDFIDAAKQIPNRVVCAMMGVPRADWEWLGELTTAAFEGADEVARSSAHAEIFVYLTDLLAARRHDPGDDLVSMLATYPGPSAAEDERQLSDEEIVFNCNGVLSGANETTRFTTAGGVLALIDNPHQWHLLKQAGVSLVPSAVEEILRWTTPGVHALRTVVAPARVGNVDLVVGDRVTLWNVSANRDEAVFDHPERFQIDRRPNRHVTFGHGPHMCLGARLARLELAAFLEEMVQRVDRMELTAAPTYNDSNFTWGVNRLPLRLMPTRQHAAAA